MSMGWTFDVRFIHSHIMAMVQKVFPGQSELGSKSKEEVLRILQSFKTEASPSNCCNSSSFLLICGTKSYE